MSIIFPPRLRDLPLVVLQLIWKKLRGMP